MHRRWLHSLQVQNLTNFFGKLVADLPSPISLRLVSAIPIQNVILDGHIALALPLFIRNLCCGSQLHI